MYLKELNYVIENEHAGQMNCTFLKETANQHLQKIQSLSSPYHAHICVYIYTSLVDKVQGHNVEAEARREGVVK